MTPEHVSHHVLARQLGRSSGFGLPEELLVAARSRLRVILWIVLFGASLSLSVRLSRALQSSDAFAREGVGVGYAALVSLVALVFLGLSHLRAAEPGFALKLGLVFEVLIGYLIGFGHTLQEVIKYGHVPFLTWTSALIILFPLIVPSPPRVTLLAASLTGCSSVAAVATFSALGLLSATASTFLEVIVSPVIAIAFAYFGSKVVYGLNVDYAMAKRLGNYELTSKLGSGGMGEVWVAHHRLLARPAAVKLVRREALGKLGPPQTLLARFEREAQVTARLRSPHTVQLYDFGIAEDGSFFYVMELLFGLNLESLVSRFGPVPAERAVHILAQVCASLAEAHENDLVHRDVKPANVFVCQYGLTSDFVKVLDFGLVKLEPLAGGQQRPALTLDNVITGTPAFMAPEQISGSQPVGRAADIYALGCVAFWLLTGRHVFEAETTVAMAISHLSEAPKPPSHGAPHALPLELDQLVLACLEKEPARRPSSMQAVAQRLAAVPISEPWDQARASAWWVQHAPEVARHRTSIPAGPRAA